MRLSKGYYYVGMSVGYRLLNLKNEYWIYGCMVDPINLHK